jgi:anion-transporting  ArsA/GET3 family ATPase
MNGVEDSGSLTASLIDAFLSYAEDKEKSIDPVQRRWRNRMLSRIQVHEMMKSTGLVSLCYYEEIKEAGTEPRS